MPELHTLMLFIAAGLLLNLTPGPDVMYISAHAMRSGLRAGAVAALGISAGCVVHVSAAALGLSALLAASSTAFALLKWLGALYLAWVGVQMLRAAMRQNTIDTIADRANGTSAGGQFDLNLPLRTVFRRGFLTNVLNPKVALFFLAFVPQFIAHDAAHPTLAFAALGLLFTFNSTWVNLGWAWAASWVAGRARMLARVTRWLDGVAGAVFIAFAAKLALTEAPTAH
ncbi:MAG: LysE family translocator [Burkholderiaceae bacterium]